MYQHGIWHRSAVAGLFLAFAACSSPSDVRGVDGQNGTNGKNATVRLVPEPPGARCPQGGTAIQTGLDDNEDGSLNDDEVEQTSYVCSGGGNQNGSMSLVRLIPEAAGAKCASGGTVVLSGLDTNADGIQSDTEVSSTQYICNSDDGKSGSAYLVKLLPEPSGMNCSRSGTAVLGGIDVNANAQLESTEVTTTQYVCNSLAEMTGASSLIRLDVEPPGANCSLGGTAVKSGLDSNANGTLDTSEVTNTTFVCNGLPGADGQNGKNSLVRLDPVASGPNCAYGGTAVKSGLDLNGDKTLSDSEVTTTQFVCSAAELFRTKWASNPRESYGSGEITNLWVPVSRRVSIYKTSDQSRIKLTVSDNFRVGVNYNGGSGWYSVRMNGSWVGCDARQHNSNTSGWNQNHHLPFANVCLTDQLPKGLYEFDVWSFASGGTSYVGAGTAGSSLLLAEEIDGTQPYAFSKAGSPTTTTSTAYVKASGREVTFTKQSASTLLKVTLADTLRVGYNQNGGWGTVMVRLDGINTSCYTGKYDAQGTGGDLHNPFVMTCILPNVSAAQHRLDVALSANSAGEAYLGWERSNPLLLVEEVSNTGRTYSNMSFGSGEISGGWAGVGARQIIHNVSTGGKSVKVTYSDTFRAVAGCNGRWGFFQLYVDYQPTGCTNSQHAWVSGNVGQDHHHPANLTCIIPNLTPGNHVFSIWSTTVGSDGVTCGSNHFGWNRGQNLLMVEELP
ncbi:hypothetical protein F0U60_00495 [Archangium minus]|uniref:DUF7151 domain-containing protein n=1 Tax=Archangium minus TaxID=83450 RepID=A0ABY9WGB6_9BACT|nr:hypothetical protein F0U60_00495 [Archangium minus]